MCEAKDIPPSERDELMGLVTQLQGQVAQLTAANEELHKQLAELKRAGKRQAAPFSKGGRSSRPKRPGRKPGMGSFSYRKSPSPDEVTEPLVEVAVGEDTCPGCGGRLEHEGVRVVYATDIPPIPRPQVTGYRVQICRCRSCGKQVRGRHPDVAPDQYGASAYRVGRRVMAAAHVLRSISEVVQTKRGRGRSFGNRLSRLLREAMELRQAYHRGEASYHLRDRPMSDADNYRLQNELGWHDDRGNLLRFLDDPSIEPTNNRAERALRPAVIARKVSHCSKNVGGADAFSAFTSVIRTLARDGGDHSLVNGLCCVFSGAPVPTPSFRTPPRTPLR